MAATRRAVRVAAAALLALAVLAATACARAVGADAGDDPRPSVVASTAVWAQIAQAVAGDGARVRSIVPAGQDPHDFQVTPTDALIVDRADLLVANGGGYDPFFSALARGVGSSAPTIDAFALRTRDAHDTDTDTHADADTDADTDTDTDADQHGHEHGHGHGVNEHVWFDFGAVEATASAVADALSAIAPAGAAGFHERAGHLHDGLERLRAQAAAIAAAGPGPVVSTEPVAHYLLELAGIEDVTPPDFGEAIEQGSDPAPALLARLRALLSGGTVRALVYNTQTDSPVTAAVRRDAERAAIPVVEVGETPPAGTGYLDWVGSVLEQLRKAVVA